MTKTKTMKSLVGAGLMAAMLCTSLAATTPVSVKADDSAVSATAPTGGFTVDNAVTQERWTVNPDGSESKHESYAPKTGFWGTVTYYWGVVVNYVSSLFS